MWCSLAAAEALGRAELWGCERHACRRRLSKPASRNPMTLGRDAGLPGTNFCVAFELRSGIYHLFPLARNEFR